MDSVELSIKRAQKLLKTPSNNGHYVSIKIKPINGSCCCFHCWTQTWNKIILLYGYLEDEGDLVVGNGDDKVILQCHESGPEIIVYLGIGIAGANLVTSVFNLILTIIKSRQQEKIGAQFRITKRVIINNKVIEENVIEADSPISKENVTLLNKKIEDILKRDES